MGYSPEYWEANKERILAERKAKYKQNKEYRQATLERSRAYRAKQRAEREAQPLTITIAGVVHPALTLSEIETTMGVSKTRIKYYQKQEYIPAAMVTRPQRLYSENQAGLIKQLSEFLVGNSKELRSPTTPGGLAATAQLEQLKSTIKANWKH